MLQREKSLHVIINVSIRTKDEIEGWGPFGDRNAYVALSLHLSIVVLGMGEVY